MSAHTPQDPRIGAGHPDVRRALAIKRGRQADRLLIDGVWAHRAATDAGARFDTIFAVPELLHSSEARRLLEQCRSRAERSYRVSPKIIDRLSERNQPNGLVSIIEQPRWSPADVHLPSDALIVVADGLQSPGNLGTVIRTIDACRADLLVVTNPLARADGSKVFQGSRGLSLSVPQLEFARPGSAIDWLRRRAVGIVVADAERGRPMPGPTCAGR